MNESETIVITALFTFIVTAIFTTLVIGSTADKVAYRAMLCVEKQNTVEACMEFLGISNELE